MKKKVLAFACAMMVTASLTACGINEVVNGTAPSSSQRQGELANSPVSTSVVHNPQGNPIRFSSLTLRIPKIPMPRPFIRISTMS